MIWQTFTATGLIAIGGVLAAFVSTIKPDHPHIRWTIFSAILIATVGAATLNGWGQEVNRDREDKRQEKRILIQNKFADFMEAGQTIENKIAGSTQNDDVTSELRKWDEQVSKFLNDNLGRVYVMRYFNLAGIPSVMLVGVDGSSLKGRMWYQAYAHLQRLDQFSAQISPVE